jgi:hypothetical protein
MTDTPTGETTVPDVVFELLATLWNAERGNRWGANVVNRLTVWFEETHGLNIEHPADRTDTEFDEWTPAQLLAFAREHARSGLDRRGTSPV